MNKRLRPFFIGFAQAFDLFGFLGPRPEDILTDEQAREVNCKALQSDWEKVGDDMRAVMGQPKEKK